MTVEALSGDRAPRRREELREFLISRRARVSPAEAGLPSGGGRRRTPGLRREEVAVLAGVGASWYQWLEQGRDITVSPQVLDSVARVLRLSEAESSHLYVLAGLNPPLPRAEPSPDFCEGLQRLIDGWMPYPAHIMDVYWNIVGFNEAARRVMHFDEARRNCLVMFFTDPAYRACNLSWSEVAPDVVAQYRAAVAKRPGDEGYAAVVGELLAVSPEFAELWARADVSAGGQMRKAMRHREAGELSLEVTNLMLPARPDLTIVVHQPVAGTGTEAKLERLVALGRRGALRSVAG